MPKYRVVSGKHHQDNQVFQPGDIVELTEAAAAGMPDRFELVVNKQPVTEVKKPAPVAAAEQKTTVEKSTSK